MQPADIKKFSFIELATTSTCAQQTNTQPRCRFVVIQEVVAEEAEGLEVEEDPLVVEEVSWVKKKKWPAQNWTKWLMLACAGRGGFQPQSFGPPAQVFGMLNSL